MASSYCCFCPIKKGIEALLYITTFMWSIILIFFWYINLLDGMFLWVPICFILCKIAGIFGIRKKISVLLIPQLVTQWLLMFLWAFLALHLIRAWKSNATKNIRRLVYQHSETTEAVDKFFEIEDPDSYPKLIALFSVFFVIQWYLHSATRYYFRQMRKERNVPVEVQMTTVNTLN